MGSRTSLVLAALAVAGALNATPAQAGCGCAKPPPPRAAVRPFVGHADQKITVFNDQLVPGTMYWVQFTSTVDGSTDWSRGKADMRRDFADGQPRAQLRVAVGNVSLGPCTIGVYSANVPLFVLGDDQFTLIGEPVVVHDFTETVTERGMQAGVGKDGTVYLAVDVSNVSDATVFTGTAYGLPLDFGGQNVAMYNEQGFLMQLLDPTSPGLFRIMANAATASDTLAYWRHEFRTYKQKHRQADAWRTDEDPEWHADGSPHIDHNHIVVAVSGRLPNGQRPAPGATPPFDLVIQSAPAPTSPLL